MEQLHLLAKPGLRWGRGQAGGRQPTTPGFRAPGPVAALWRRKRVGANVGQGQSPLRHMHQPVQVRLELPRPAIAVTQLAQRGSSRPVRNTAPMAQGPAMQQLFHNPAHDVWMPCLLTVLALPVSPVASGRNMPAFAPAI